MKLAKLSLMMVAICAVSTNYSMEREKTEAQRKLERAEGLAKKAHNVFREMDIKIYFGCYRSEEIKALKQRGKNEAVNYVKQAQPLFQAIIQDKTADQAKRDRAMHMLQKMDKRLKKFDK